MLVKIKEEASFA